jgi:hypothetical protein
MNDQLHLAHSASNADRRYRQAYRSLAANSRWQPGTSLARGLFLAWFALGNPDLASRGCERGLYWELRRMSFA